MTSAAPKTKISDEACPACGWRHEVGFWKVDDVVKVTTPPIDTTRGVFEPGAIVKVASWGDAWYRVKRGKFSATLYACQLDDASLEEFIANMEALDEMSWRPTRRHCNID